MSRAYYLRQEAKQGAMLPFGCDPKFANAPIVNLPEDDVKTRIRIRAHQMAKVFVKTANGDVTEYFAGPDGPHALKLLWPMGVNSRRAA